MKLFNSPKSGPWSNLKLQPGKLIAGSRIPLVALFLFLCFSGCKKDRSGENDFALPKRSDAARMLFEKYKFYADVANQTEKVEYVWWNLFAPEKEISGFQFGKSQKSKVQGLDYYVTEVSFTFIDSPTKALFVTGKLKYFLGVDGNSILWANEA